MEKSTASVVKEVPKERNQVCCTERLTTSRKSKPARVKIFSLILSNTTTLSLLAYPITVSRATTTGMVTCRPAYSPRKANTPRGKSISCTEAARAAEDQCQGRIRSAVLRKAKAMYKT